MKRIYIAGAGPGSADLLTVRAARILSRAEAVIHDRLVSREVLALVRPEAEVYEAGKAAEGMQEETQRRILALLEECAARYETVVRLKGGDPMVFGRGAEEWLYLAARGYSVEVIPGISSAVAVPELAGIPVTLRGVAGGFAAVAGHRGAGWRQQWAAYAAADTLVILMGAAQRAGIARCLMEHGRSPATPVAIIENGTTPRERVTVTELSRVGEVEISAPAVIVVGEVVRVRQQLCEAVEQAALVGA